MIEFKPVRLEDRAVIERYTMPSGICNCDLAFANMYCWQAVFHSAWAEIGGFLVIRFQIDGGERIGYMQPVGEGDFGPILPLLREDAHAHGQRLRIIGLTDEGRDTIRRIVPCHFAFESDRALEDYVYNADDLRNLAGRRYQPKRNHINRFTRPGSVRHRFRLPPSEPAKAERACRYPVKYDQCPRFRKWRHPFLGSTHFPAPGSSPAERIPAL